MQRRWYFPNKMENSFPSRRWTNKICWRRSGTENIYLDTGSPNSRRRSKKFFLPEWEGSPLPLPQDSLHFRSPFQETSYTSITLNQKSNFIRREKNHSFFHWNTLTSPELFVRIWMSSKRNASMIIGTSMGQEICLILGQVSPSLLHWVRNLQKDICGPGRDWQNGR